MQLIAISCAEDSNELCNKLNPFVHFEKLTSAVIHIQLCSPGYLVVHICYLRCAVNNIQLCSRNSSEMPAMQLRRKTCNLESPTLQTYLLHLGLTAAVTTQLETHRETAATVDAIASDYNRRLSSPFATGNASPSFQQ